MTAVDWWVILGGAAAIVWVNWYFLLAERPADAADAADAADDGVRERMPR